MSTQESREKQLEYMLDLLEYLQSLSYEVLRRLYTQFRDRPLLFSGSLMQFQVTVTCNDGSEALQVAEIVKSAIYVTKSTLQKPGLVVDRLSVPPDAKKVLQDPSATYEIH